MRRAYLAWRVKLFERMTTGWQNAQENASAVRKKMKKEWKDGANFCFFGWKTNKKHDFLFSIANWRVYMIGNFYKYYDKKILQSV